MISASSCGSSGSEGRGESEGVVVVVVLSEVIFLKEIDLERFLEGILISENNAP